MSADVKLRSIKSWRAADKHTGIGKSGSIPYTYEHTAKAPQATTEVYRVETYIPFVKPTPLHRNIYYVPGSPLGAFLSDSAETGEIIVDVQPLSAADAVAELEAFRRTRHQLTSERKLEALK